MLRTKGPYGMGAIPCVFFLSVGQCSSAGTALNPTSAYWLVCFGAFHEYSSGQPPLYSSYYTAEPLLLKISKYNTKHS